jgi:predicted ATPase
LSTLAVPDPRKDLPLAALGQLEAVRLFSERAVAVQPLFQVTPENAAAVADICQRLEGIPLALELAAARVRALSVGAIAVRLSDRFRLLTGGDAAALPRQQTLRACIDWSYDLLSEPERSLLRRLAVFAGGWTLEAAEAVVTGDEVDKPDVLDLLTHLVEKSLVEFDAEGVRYRTTVDQSGALVDKPLVRAAGDSIPRYRMLETTRAYALERLAEAGEMQTTLRGHAHAVLAVLEQFERFEWRWQATGSAQPAAAVELDNLRGALDWADAAVEGPLAVALAGVSYSVWWSSSHLAEGLARCLGLRPHVDAGVSTTAAARFWLTIAKLGVYSIRRESYDAAVRAAALYRELDDDQRVFEALTFAAVQGTRFATVAQMEAQINEAARLEHPEWSARQRAKLQFARCFWFARQGRIEEALACAQRQVAICRGDGVEVGALYAMSNVTFMESLLGRPQEALEHARTAIARLHELGADAGAGHHHFSEMIALLMLNRSEEALVAARNAYPRLSHEGDQYRLLLPLALINASHGRLNVAARVAGFDDAIQARTGENVSIVAPLLRGRLNPLLAAGFSADERTRLAAEGAAMHDEETFKLAFGNAA